MTSISKFIDENKEIIDEIILSKCPNCRLDDAERRLWILNDEALYNWAKSQGVNI
jgi:hypothetical protein